jgi:hypothetical protein
VADSFVWGGITWGPGELDSFISYLSAHGSDYSTWADNHPDAAAIFTGGSSSSADVPNPAPIGTALESEEQAGATPAEAATETAALAAAGNAEGVDDVSSSELEQDAGQVEQTLTAPTSTSSTAPAATAAAPGPPSVVQVSFTHDELVSLWEYVGGPSSVADIAAAIALAESSGCKYAHAGPTDTRPSPQCVYRETDQENSDGLWQVNLFAHSEYTDDELYDAVGNARAALAVSSGGSDFSPWTTFTSGAFTQYLTGYPPTGSLFTAVPAAELVAPTQPAGAASAWSNVLDQYATGVPAANTSVGQLADSLTDIFKG